MLSANKVVVSFCVGLSESCPLAKIEKKKKGRSKNKCFMSYKVQSFGALWEGRIEEGLIWFEE